jgi:hydroxymethylbilane synthase
MAIQMRRRAIESCCTDLDIQIKVIRSRRDLMRDQALSQVGGKGLFITDQERPDFWCDPLAAHSLKAMVTVQPKALTVGAILEPADSHDVLVECSG